MRASVLVCFALLTVVAPLGVAADELAPGDVYLTLENDDFRGGRFGAQAVWLQPTFSWLQLEAGGRYAEYDRASWGFGIVGAYATLPAGIGFASLRYEGGAGDGTGGRYGHQIAELTFTRALWRKKVFADVGLQWIDVGSTRDDLGKVGLTFVANDWLQLDGGYLHSVFNGLDTDGWNVGTRLQLRGMRLFAGFAQSTDTIDLRSIGRGRVRGETAEEYAAGVTLPYGPHGITLAATRYDGAGDVRHTMSFTFQWSLSHWPWQEATASDRVARLQRPR